MSETRTCEYGCGQEANYQLKNGKWCCSKSQNSCPTIRKKNSKSKREEGGSAKLFTSKDNPTLKKESCSYCDKKFGLSTIKRHEEACPFNPDNKTYCNECGELLTEKSQNKFCSESCFAKYNNRKRKKHSYSTKGKTEIRECPGCGEQKEFSMHTRKDIICSSCRKERQRKRQEQKKKQRECSVCGRKECEQDNKICSWLSNGGKKTLKRFGFDISRCGITSIFDEVKKLEKKLIKEYSKEKKSSYQIAKENGFTDWNIVKDILERFGHETRNNSEANVNAIRTGRLEFDPPTNTDYKSGHHQTWFGEEVYLRSSYEFDYAEKLDEQEVHYEVEELRIPYEWEGQEHIYVPDFHIPDKNLVVEIKGSHFYKKDKERVEKKLKACRDLGYNTLLVVDGEEIVI